MYLSLLANSLNVITDSLSVITALRKMPPFDVAFNHTHTHTHRAETWAGDSLTNDPPNVPHTVHVGSL